MFICVFYVLQMIPHVFEHHVVQTTVKVRQMRRDSSKKEKDFSLESLLTDK